MILLKMDIYLDKLELFGFKSFPEKTVLKFHRGITCVVGPNGCGKSNIVDSILWVMGEQKIKNLRGENNEDLIFSGSASKKSLGMTEVGVFFSTGDNETYIARRFFRTGESKYILNDKYCRNKDIQDELFKLRLGGTNYFIFEQGSIEKLVALKPTEKRILIEEAAGIAQYLLRKKETANKLIISQQNLDNIDILIVDKENRLKDLKNQVNFARRYRKIKSDKVNCLKAFLKKKYDIYRQGFDKYKGEIEKIMSRETVEIKEISSLEKELITLEEKRWKIDKELKLNQQRIFDFNNNILSKKNEIEKSRQRKGFTGQKINEIKNSMTTDKNEIANIENQTETIGKYITDMETKLAQGKTTYEEQEAKITSLEKKLEDTNAASAGLKNDIFNAQSRLSTVGNRVQDIDKRVQKIETEITGKKNFIAELNEQVKPAEIADKENRLTALKIQANEQKLSFKNDEEEHARNKNAVEGMIASLKELNSEINNLENQRLKYLEIKKKIMGEEVDISGIEQYGFLQDKIESGKEHHKILENFYYNEMDALLVKNHEDISRTAFNKFVIARKPAGLPAGIEKEEGFVAYVKDLFSLKEPCPGSHDPFKNGVLVDNLKNAIRLFIKYGINVVTREAETIDADGVLVRNREKGILDVIDEIREIDKKKAGLEKNITKLNRDLEAEKEKQPALIKKVEAGRIGLNNLEKEILHLETRLDTLEKNRETNAKRIALSQSEIELLLIEKKKLQDEFDTFDAQKNELEQNFKNLTQKRETYQAEIQVLKEEINRIEKDFLQKENDINLVKEKINSSRANRKILADNKTKLQNNIKAYQQEILKLDSEISALDKNKETADDEIKKLTAEKNELEETVKKEEAEFNSLNEEIKEKSTHLQSRRKQLEEIKDEKNHLEIEISAIKKDLYQLEDISFKELNTELVNIDTAGLDELMADDMNHLEEEVKSADEKLIKMRDSDRLNFSAESEFEILTRDYDFMLSQKEDIVKAIQDMNEAIKRIDEESQASFLDAFDQVKGNFLKNFQILFEGGEAELSIIDSENILESGLEIKAQPPGKKLLNLKLLSGGEKTLTSLAFLFALFEYKPSPFCVFDEVDASLDEANIQRFLKFLHKLKDKTQFVIITHNFKTMEEADFIYGITMNEPGISTIYSMKMTASGELERQ